MRSGADTTGVSAPSARHAVIDSRMTRTFNLQTPTQPNDRLMLKSIKIRGCRQFGGTGRWIGRPTAAIINPMAQSEITRRVFVGAMTALGLSAADDGWVELFDGRSLQGWRPSENKSSWKVLEGQLAAEGPRSHLFYTGPVHGADFRNFELEVEVLTRPACNSGVYFHTAYQERDFPNKGFEIQINNTATGERSKTGSLYGLRNVYKQFVPDDQWFKIHAAVRGKNVQIRLNGMLVVDYTEPDPPVIPDGPEKGRFLDRGTFALQCHNNGSQVRFRGVRMRPLPDGVPTPEIGR